MKIYKVVDGVDTPIATADREKIAVLKLVNNGVYIDKVGMRQDEYYMLEEFDLDGEALGCVLGVRESEIEDEVKEEISMQLITSPHFSAIMRVFSLGPSWSSSSIYRLNCLARLCSKHETLMTGGS
jgi:hypothetical protein